VPFRPAEEAVRAHKITIRLELAPIEREIDDMPNVAELERTSKAGIQVVVAELAQAFSWDLVDLAVAEPRRCAGSIPKCTRLSLPFVVEKPGATSRVGVEDYETGARSTAWRIWTVRNADDIYVAARPVAGIMKISLHATGSWSYGFVSDEKARPFLGPDRGRHAEVWQKPNEFHPGWRRAYRIIIPGPELRIHAPGVPLDENVLCVPLRKAQERIAAVEVLLIEARIETIMNFTGALDLAALNLPSGVRLASSSDRNP
jgi:hypothetical protein